MDSISVSGRFLGGEDGNPLQYSCLENLMDRGAWRATGHGVSKSGTRLSEQPPITTTPLCLRRVWWSSSSRDTVGVQVVLK